MYGWCVGTICMCCLCICKCMCCCVLCCVLCCWLCINITRPPSLSQVMVFSMNCPQCQSLCETRMKSVGICWLCVRGVSMPMCVCTYMYTSVHTYICVYQVHLYMQIFSYIRTCVCINLFLWVSVYLRTYVIQCECVYMCVYMHVCVCIVCVRTYVIKWLYVCACTCTYAYKCILCVSVCLYICTFVYMYVCVVLLSEKSLDSPSSHPLLQGGDCNGADMWHLWLPLQRGQVNSRGQWKGDTDHAPPHRPHWPLKGHTEGEESHAVGPVWSDHSPLTPV